VKRLRRTNSPGGIVIPDTAAEKPVQGRSYVGKGKILERRPGPSPRRQDRRQDLFGKYSGTEVRVEGEESLVRERDVMAD